MRLVIIPALFSLFLSSSSRAADPVFRAGAFAQDITPTTFPISVSGNMRDVQATVAHDRLHARCLVLDDGKTRLAFAVCDSCMIPREVFEEAKKKAAAATGIPAANMLFSATHTHSAPTAAGVFQSEPEHEYPKFLAGKIAEGIIAANKRLAPAKIGWGAADEPNQLFNRRWVMKPGSILQDPFGSTTDKVKMNPGYQNPGLDLQAGPVDPQVSVLSVITSEGKHLALLANYSLHYVGGYPALSADYFGAFCERVAVLLEAGPEFVGIMSNGTSGDVNNVNFSGKAPGKREPGEQIRLVADSVAKAALAAVKNIKYQSHVTLAAAEKDLQLGVRLPSPADITRAKEILGKANKVVLETMPEIYARETVLLAKFPKTVPVKIQALRIGNLGICAIPCEVFTEIGLELKKKSRLKPTFTIELANGYNGYLPTPQQHQWGGYETWRARSSYLEVEASSKITATLLDLLERTASAP
ncbi:MAG: hypothetical protein EXR99_10970 [Gemmataceae bacterium]|nr:hypothetical protein [Gemmataceae bacterium]